MRVMRDELATMEAQLSAAAARLLSGAEVRLEALAARVAMRWRRRSSGAASDAWAERAVSARQARRLLETSVLRLSVPKLVACVNRWRSDWVAALKDAERDSLLRALGGYRALESRAPERDVKGSGGEGRACLRQSGDDTV